tara:strand:+ start:19 stop:363 length:345 start_codon:yes stop_codon:yes gene_type:complete
MNNETPEIQNTIAIRVLRHAQAKHSEFSLDPFTIIAISNCIISIVKLLYMCYSKEGTAGVFKKQNVLHRFLLRREVNKRFASREERRAMYTSMSDVSKTLSESELFQLLDSIQE